MKFPPPAEEKLWHRGWWKHLVHKQDGLETTTAFRKSPIFSFRSLQTPSSGSATSTCWAGGSCATPCSTLAGPPSSTSSSRGCAFPMTPSPGWSPSTSASWRPWLRSGALGKEAEGRLQQPEVTGMENRPLVYSKNDVRVGYLGR